MRGAEFARPPRPPARDFVPVGGRAREPVSGVCAGNSRRMCGPTRAKVARIAPHASRPAAHGAPDGCWAIETPLEGEAPAEPRAWTSVVHMSRLGGSLALQRAFIAAGAFAFTQFSPKLRTCLRPLTFAPAGDSRTWVPIAECQSPESFAGCRTRGSGRRPRRRGQTGAAEHSRNC